MARTVLGPGPRLATVDRLRGSTKKGVYRLTLTDQSTVIVYIWNPAENFWLAGAEDPASTVDPADPFAEASGAALFEADHVCLEAAGVPVPRVFYVDRSQRHYPADVAFVEGIGHVAGFQAGPRFRACPPRATGNSSLRRPAPEDFPPLTAEDPGFTEHPVDPSPPDVPQNPDVPRKSRTGPHHRPRTGSSTPGDRQPVT